MGTTDELDTSSTRRQPLSRRSVLKAGAHAAWIVPAVQVVGAAPAFAACSTGQLHTHAFTFTKVKAEWNEQGHSGKYTLTVIYRINDSDPCPMSGLKVQLKAPDNWNGVQDHSTPGQYAATKVDDGKGRNNKTSDIWSFLPLQESPGNWYVEMQVQASNSLVNHGTLTFTASLDGHSESTTFTV